GYRPPEPFCWQYLCHLGSTVCRTGLLLSRPLPLVRRLYCSTSGHHHVRYGTDLVAPGLCGGVCTPWPCGYWCIGTIHHHARSGLVSDLRLFPATRIGHWRDSGGLLPRWHLVERDDFSGPWRPGPVGCHYVGHHLAGSYRHPCPDLLP